MAVTIKPDNSLVRSGILSTVIAKISGKIFANPKPTNTIPTNVSDNIPDNKASMPTNDVSTVTIKKDLADKKRNNNEPEKRPIRIGKKNCLV